MKKFVFLMLSIVMATSVFSQGGISLDQQRKIAGALKVVSTYYVDTLNDKQLAENTIKSMLKELDPHSSYISKEEVERVNEPLEGSFEGIGVQFQILDDTILVVQCISGCPAEKVGVQAGDRIVWIGDECVANKKIQTSQIFKKLRGAKGTVVTIRVKRGSNPELIDFKIIRDKIPLYTVDAHYMLTKDIGFIKINNFGSTTVDEFRSALVELKKMGMKDLILSLQNNGGGYLQAANGIADEFLSKDKLIVYTQGLNQPKRVFNATSDGGFERGRLVVLIDEFSASASEIVTGALQDWDRSVVVGRRSFGKGLVQGQFPLFDGSVIRLTVARYYTPSGRCIQKSYKNGYEDYEKDLTNRFKRGEFVHADSIHFADSLKYKTLELKRTVYGGGGIMPDVFVPLDTTYNSKTHRDLIAQGVIGKVIGQYVDKNRNELKSRYPSFEKFKNKFDVDDNTFEQLVLTAQKDKVKIVKTEFEAAKSILRLELKALIARDLWGMNEYFQVMERDNESLQKAIEILITPNAYGEILSAKTQKK